MEIHSEVEIHSINLSNDLKKIIVCLNDKRIEIWNIDTFSLIKEIKLTVSLIENVLLTSDNKYLIFSDENNTVIVWDYDQNLKLQYDIPLKLSRHKNEITTIKEVPDHKKIITGSEDNDINIWDLSGKLLYSLKGHYAGITALAVSPNGDLLISGSEDYDIRIWEIKTGKLLKTLEEHEFSINNIKISPSGSFFISGSKEKLIVWDLKTKKIIKKIEDLSEPLKTFSITPDEKYLLGAYQNHIICYNLKTFELESMEKLKSEIFFIDLNYNGKYLIIGVENNTIIQIEFLKWLEVHKLSSKSFSSDKHIPFRAYKGKDPYIFVCYAHKDKELVYDEMRWIKSKDFRIWYDEGIPPTTEWPEEIEKAIKNCTLFLVFITTNAVGRENVRNEINFALKKSKKFLAVFLEPTELKFGLELRLSLKQAILKYELYREIYLEKLLETLNSVF